MENGILNIELSPEDEKLLRESLTTWKEGVYADLMEQVEELKQQKIEELEELNRKYQEELKEEFAQKMIVALDEMREEIKAEVISEMVSSNPELQILEKIKELIAPTLNEEFYENIYADVIQTLREENEALKREKELDEGAATLAELIAPYSEKTQNIILAMIKEGGPEEVTEQFYELIESLGSVMESEYDEGDDDFDYEDDDESQDEEDEDVEEDFDEDGSYIKEGVSGEETVVEKSGRNVLKEIASMARIG